jgi:hypothetical protein
LERLEQSFVSAAAVSFSFSNKKASAKTDAHLIFCLSLLKSSIFLKNPTFFSPEQMSQVSEKSTKNVRAETGRKTGKQPFILQ